MNKILKPAKETLYKLQGGIIPMNQSMPQMFNYQDSRIRVVLINGEPWFVAKDVCAVLEIKQTVRAVTRLDEDEVNLIHVTDSLGRLQESYAVNEPGLYSLISSSRKPEAKAFKRWVNHEVLPSIRKTGSYSVQPQQQLTIPQTMSEALRLAADLFEENQKLLPKAEAYDQFMLAENACTIRNAAKIFGTGQQRLFRLLREKEILIRKDNTPYQKYVDAGYFRVVMKQVRRDGQRLIVPVTLVTPKGLEFLAKLLDFHPVLTITA